MIFVGPTLVGQSVNYSTYLIQDEAFLDQPIYFKLSHRRVDADDDEDNIIGAYGDG